ncbi:MAG TPA: hypothetical protein VLS27_06455 [Gammaproteobacteria bacterium]|nr:hypothetical protein [Gammaproteobacteria bacterium]
MKFDKKHKLFKAASKEGGRYAMSAIQVLKDGIARVTNCKMAARVPVDITGDNIPDNGVLVPTEFVKKVISCTKKDEVDIFLGIEARTRKLSINMHTAFIEGEFPKVDRVVERPKFAIRFGINTKMLADLADALGSDVLRISVPVEMDKDTGPQLTDNVTKPIYVEAPCRSDKKPDGAIMPVTIET